MSTTTPRHQARPELLETAALVPVEELSFYPGNARLHDDELLVESLRVHGQYAAIRVQRSTGHVLMGNGTFHAAQALGWSHVAVTWIDCDEAEARKLVLIDNQASDRAMNDPGDLAKLLAGLDGDYLGTGFEEDDLTRLLESIAEPLVLDKPLPSGASYGSLEDRFGVPPFTVLDARRGSWRERKREWLSLGIASELGRDPKLLGGGMAETDEPHKLHDGVIGDGLPTPRFGFRGAERAARERSGAYGAVAHQAADGSLSYETTTGATSIFDPVLCELVYRWFSAEGHHVLDPWAGGSVRGIVASRLGRAYTGIELRPEQVAANRAQAHLARDPQPTWLEGESASTLRTMAKASADLLFGCPPYYDLERYSDDPRDLSTMTPEAFDNAMAANIDAAAWCLRTNSFAVFVVGNVRHPSGRLMDMGGMMVRACEASGLRFYNDGILITPAGSLPVRAGRAFERTRVLGRTHQQVLVFVKGDRKKAADRCGTVDVSRELDEALASPLEAAQDTLTD